VVVVADIAAVPASNEDTRATKRLREDIENLLGVGQAQIRGESPPL
jgi:hypothetical protein